MLTKRAHPACLSTILPSSSPPPTSSLLLLLLNTHLTRQLPIKPHHHHHHQHQHRNAHTHHTHRETLTNTTPPPLPFVPTPSTFLTLIGRNLSTHASKFPTWPSLFSATSAQLKDLGIEPARSRRYLLWWRERFRRGVVGVGGDLKWVHWGDKEGEGGWGEVRVVDVDVDVENGLDGNGSGTTPGIKPTRRMIVNTPPTDPSTDPSTDTNTTPPPPTTQPTTHPLTPITHLRIRGAREIVGPFVETVKGSRGSVARLRVQEGMWEVRRGVKVDGGERRKKMVRRQRVLEERKGRRV